MIATHGVFRRAGFKAWKMSLVIASILTFSSGWSSAAPVVVLDYLNLRFGPSIYYNVIEVIPAGWIIESVGCVAGWCQVNVNGIVGYVDANYLGFGPPPYYGNYGYPYAYGTYPYAGYDPYNSYYSGYAEDYPGAPYPGGFVDAHAEAGTVHSQTNRTRGTVLTKNRGTTSSLRRR